MKIIAMGCMSTQQHYELNVGKPLAAKPAVISNKMDRGLDNEENEEDEWWKKPEK